MPCCLILWKIMKMKRKNAVECKHAFLCPLVPELMSQIGKVLVLPDANATNKWRFCVLWDTSRKRPGWVHINTHGMKSLCFKL